MIKGFKGFNRDMQCQGFQFEVGGTYQEEKAIACQAGFHFCENPLDVLGYYPPADSRYAEVEGSGSTDRDGSDSKVACTELGVKAEITLNALISVGVKFILDQVDWANKKEHQTEDSSAATNTGNRSAATNTGNRSAATNTGYQSAATVEGQESIAVATGYGSKARGALGCWIVVVEWDENADHILGVQCTKVDGQRIKADTFYRLVNGEFIEV